MWWYVLLYVIGFLIFFAWICYDEVKSFLGENKPQLLLGFAASFFWPLCLIVMLMDFLEDFFGRIVSRKPRGP